MKIKNKKRLYMFAESSKSCMQMFEYCMRLWATVWPPLACSNAFWWFLHNIFFIYNDSCMFSLQFEA